MKYIYITTENIDRQPILTSQVIPLLKGLERKGVPTFLVTSGDSNYSDTRRKSFIKSNNFQLLKAFFFFLKNNSDSTSVIHVRSYWAMIPVLFLKLFKRFKVIWDPRGLLPQEYIMRFGKLKGGGAFIVFSILEFFAVVFTDLIILVSDNFKTYFISKYSILNEDKLHVIRTFSAASSRVSIGRPVGLSFVYSGSIEAWQCIDQLKVFFDNIQRLESCTLTILTKDVEKALNFFTGYSTVTVKSLHPDELTEEISKYSFAIIFREYDVINHVAAPVKVADYIKARTPIITNGNVGDYSDALLGFGVGFSWSDNIDLPEFVNKLNDYKFNDIAFVKFEEEYLSFDRAVNSYYNLILGCLPEGKL
ncbi:hypothetical protein ACIGCM_11415 [Pseudomonas sp. NPDC078700]|uniref:hypothetical protein n=1 Tax=Pseudomonas sp. NPDC078700 TaxID=3364424 RepID=UPI0037CA9FE8